jgi:hypothetical protein
VCNDEFVLEKYR